MSSDEYSDEGSEDVDSYDSEESRKKKKDKDKKKVKKKGKKKEKKKDKKKSKKDKKHSKKDKKRDRKRRRSPSDSYSYDGDDSRSDSCDRRDRGRRNNSRKEDGGAPRPYDFPMTLPTSGDITIEQACEAAGRGVATGNTVLDDEVEVFGPDEELIKDPDKYDNFDEIKAFDRDIRDALKDAGFKSPSQIQAYTWPLGVRSKDIIGIAATGSGKTLAFLLPAFSAMLDDGHRPEREGPGLLVLSPTRELAQQIETEACRFGRTCGMRSVAMYGGAPKGNQLSKYRAGVHCIVACPGRMNDFLEGGQVRLEGASKLVLDEADRMLDMGFEPQIRKILAKVPRKRHTMFFTATWPKEVRHLAMEILHKPYKVMIGKRHELKGNQDITQLVRVLPDPNTKHMAIVDLFREAGLYRRDSAGKALVFCNTKRLCEQLCQSLQRNGLPCASIHGDKDQMQRDDALNGLKSGRFKILVATDVAARGLDIKGVGLVVNFDAANNAEDYVHRIGRTGRAGARGFAVTFITGADAHKAKGIVEVMERTDQVIDPMLRHLADSSGGGKGRRRGRDDGFGKGSGKGGRDMGPPPLPGFNAGLTNRDLAILGRGRSRSRSRSRSLSF